MVKQKINIRSRLFRELSEKIKIVAYVETALKLQRCPNKIAIDSQGQITLISVKKKLTVTGRVISEIFKFIHCRPPAHQRVILRKKSPYYERSTIRHLPFYQIH